MAVLVVTTARVKNWKALQKAWRVTFTGRNPRLRAARIQLYRNTHDASQALLVIEAPNLEALTEVGEAVSESMRAQLKDISTERTWEVIEHLG